ncbi:coenzyme F420-0:L-glutamate ligase [Candidatus Bathyarchaeota archaeon]|nr:coenzyme F420-0:L-glutamate ligase [Candidatus Bathyarchaeota archaeon]
MPEKSRKVFGTYKNRKRPTAFLKVFHLRAPNVVLLPKDPDSSAESIRREVRRLTGCDVAVLVSDTHGRPLRMGEINVAIGVAGIKPTRDRRDEKDLFGYSTR